LLAEDDKIAAFAMAEEEGEGLCQWAVGEKGRRDTEL
jgi:hypothetical protein